MKHMHKIAVLGDRKSLLMYRPTGFELFMPHSELEARRLIERLKSEHYAVLFVTEKVYRMAQRTIDALDSAFLPAIIILPGYGENGQEGIKRMNTLMEMAIGAKL